MPTHLRVVNDLGPDAIGCPIRTDAKSGVIQCQFVDLDGVTQLRPTKDFKDGNLVLACCLIKGFGYNNQRYGVQKQWTFIQRLSQELRPKGNKKHTDVRPPTIGKDASQFVKARGTKTSSSSSSSTSDASSAPVLMPSAAVAAAAAAVSAAHAAKVQAASAAAAAAVNAQNTQQNAAAVQQPLAIPSAMSIETNLKVEVKPEPAQISQAPPAPAPVVVVQPAPVSQAPASALASAPAASAAEDEGIQTGTRSWIELKEQWKNRKAEEAA